MELEQRLRKIYSAFNARDLDTALQQMTPDVDWPNAWEGGRVQGREHVRDYWMRQWSALDPTVEPLSVTTHPDGRIAVEVHQVVKALDGSSLGEATVLHVYTLRDGLIERMDVEEPSDSA